MRYWKSHKEWNENDNAARREVRDSGGHGATGIRTRHAWNAATQRAIEIVNRHMDYPQLRRELKEGLDDPKLYSSDTE